MKILIDGVEFPDHFAAVAQLEAGGSKKLELVGVRTGPDESLLCAAMIVHANRAGVEIEVGWRPEGLMKILQTIHQLAELDEALGRGELDADMVAAAVDPFLAGVIRTLRLAEIDFPHLLSAIYSRGAAARELN